jgi:hypothetical protein
MSPSPARGERLACLRGPDSPGVLFHDILTVSLNLEGVITHVSNNIGAITPRAPSRSSW